MNCESWDSQEWLLNLDKLGGEIACFVCDDDSACQGKITIKPCVPESSAICFHSDLEVARLGAFRDGADLDGYKIWDISFKFEILHSP